ncbi:DUF1796 family putative cysteine peptidase [Aliivibrio fischeri]|uniref:DUF1796 family putative cysteine peptidase n=1 Tax=Aliivibrio fischeri TaxID=668 RepID=UPI0012D91A2F|nr:DUF1796 family putative cysteine peptidase [Aliivibrio fischeri]MUK26515.1 hypothetical protein [Aliivibrio fischeri]MUK33723.1 hypothetical protein [Aliivibrio fischeri]
MKDVYISLGSACDVSIMLNSLGLRNQSYPFDWLWNLDSGLSALIPIIESDFKDVRDRSSYVWGEHYRFDEQVLLYRCKPSIVHLHSNPSDNKKDHETLCRRYDRFIDEMSSTNRKNFIYYRSVEEDSLNGKSDSIEDSIRLLILEGVEFIELMLIKHPNIKGKINLSLVIQSDVSIPFGMIGRLSREFRLNNNIIRVSNTINRDDTSLFKMLRWKLKWTYIILSMSKRPAIVKLLDFIKISVSFAIKKINL